MTQESYRHPIAPPPWRVQEWGEEAARRQYTGSETDQHIAAEAAQWGADVELKACCEWINRECGNGWGHGTKLRAARRPKPPSLKEQALALVEQHEDGWRPSPKDWDTIRRALEQLPDNE
jgi:hypothetical protein